VIWEDVILFYRIDLIGEATNSGPWKTLFPDQSWNRFFYSLLSLLRNPYIRVGGIPLFITNPITVASFSFSLRSATKTGKLGRRQRGLQKGYLPAWSVMKSDGWRVFLCFYARMRICSTLLHCTTFREVILDYHDRITVVLIEEYALVYV